MGICFTLLLNDWWHFHGKPKRPQKKLKTAILILPFSFDLRYTDAATNLE